MYLLHIKITENVVCVVNQKLSDTERRDQAETPSRSCPDDGNEPDDELSHELVKGAFWVRSGHFWSSYPARLGRVWRIFRLGWNCKAGETMENIQ
jgi:hypothetical protein